jgi:hypothetical protein
LPDTRESLGKYQDFPFLKSDFPCPKSNFPQQLSDFLQWLSAFLNGSPLSSMAFQFSSTAFRFPRNPRKSIYGGKYTKDHNSSFVFPATHSPSFVIPATMSTSPQHTPVVHLCSQQCAKPKLKYNMS